MQATATLANTVDPVGIETLLRMADVVAYNDWVYRQIAPYLGQHLLEVGSGIGNMTGYYADRSRLVCVDLLAESLALVREKLGDRPNLHTVHGDICAPETKATLQSFEFDTAVMLNVLEHIRDDAGALQAIRDVLVPGGRLVLLVPALRPLYGSLDQELGHYRRYERLELQTLVRGTGYELERLWYMNLPGILGWYTNARITKSKLLPRRQLALFNVLAPLFERLERRFPPPVGQSLIAIARKPGAKP